MLSLRKATLEDAAALEVFYARSYGELLPGDYDTDVVQKALPFFSAPQPDLLQSGTYHVAQVDGAVVGAGGFPHAAPGTAKLTPGIAHIRHFGTDPDCVRRGIATALMEHVCIEARNCGVLTLECLSPLTGVPFYERAGFIREKEVTVPIGGKLPLVCVMMGKRLEW